MKKITILLTSSLFVAAVAAEANADNYNYVPYVGAGYMFNQTKASGFNPHYSAGGIYIGSDYSKYFSTELFANQSCQDKRAADGGNVRTSYYNYGLDILAYLPLGESEKISLVATTGVGEYVYKTKFSPVNRHHEHGIGYRFGGGVKYSFDGHWQTRAIGRYAKFNKLGGYDHATEYALSVEYHF